MTMALSGPSGIIDLMNSLMRFTPLSIQSIGYWPNVNVISNIRYKNMKNSGKPMYLFVIMASRT